MDQTVQPMRRPQTKEAFPSTTIRFSYSFRDKVRRFADAQDVTMNLLIAMALDEYMQRHGAGSALEDDESFRTYLQR